MTNTFAGRSEEYLIETRAYLVAMIKDIDRLINRRNRDAQKGKSEVRQAVKELMEQIPQMSKEEITNTLIKNNFDFRGRNPKKAVNVSWYYLSEFVGQKGK